MNRLVKIAIFIDKNLLNFFLLAFFLVRIPPFYLFYPLKSSLLTTHTLARLLIVFIFGSILIKSFLKKKPLFGKNNRRILIIFLTYFFFQSVSVIGSVNLSSFFQRYKDIVFPGLFLFLVVYFKNHYRKIISVLLITLVINFFYQMVIFLAPSFFKSMGEIFIYQAHFDLVSINLERSRIFIETYDEITIPLIVIGLTQAKDKREKILMFLLFSMAVLPSFLSNFRSRILMLVFAVFVSFFFLLKKRFSYKTTILSVFLIFGYLTYIVLTTIFGFSFVDRFEMKDKKEDVMTVESRINNIGASFDMAASNPLFGIGLGNYYDYLSGKKKIRLSLFNWKNKESEIASTNPHNIFAQILSETGYVSLIFYILMIGYFVFYDWRTLKEGNNPYSKGFVISFWTLFIYSLFNPTTTLIYNLLFWSLRGLI